jgi:hypothetical protein
MNARNLAALVCLALAAFSGCSPRRDAALHANSGGAQAATIGSEEDEKVILMVIDVSPSFVDRITKGGDAYRLMMRIIARYTRASAGSQDRLVIATISGSSKALIFDGTPHELKRTYPTADAFRDMLASRTGSGGSRVHEGIRDALRYVLDDPRVDSGKLKVGMFVLSDLEDTGGTGHEAEQIEGNMNHELSRLGWRGGVAGFYYASQSELIRWRQRLQSLGIKNFVVESEIVSDPPLPDFDS